MFKAARWRSDKNKFKAVFKFQFQAAQVPLSGAEAATVSLVPLDVGKPTVRSERVSAVGGTCNWSNPIYETVKLVRDPKSGNINEKFYKFLVSAAGPARAGLLGEATINLADYAEASKASSVSVPLKAGALLHVTIQRIQGDVEGREAEGNGDATFRRKGTTLQSQLYKCDDEEGGQSPNGMNAMNSVKDGSHDNRETTLKFQSFRNLPAYADLSYSLQKSHSFDAISVTSSDSSLELYTLRENSVHNGCIQNDLPMLLSPPANIDIRAKLLTNSGDLSGISAPDRSTDGSTNSSVESGLTERLQSSGDTLESLRNEVAFLTRKFEVSELELQTLRKQVVKDNRRGQHLSKEVSSLKEERDALLIECEELKLSQIRTNESESEMEDPLSMLEEIKQELDHEKNAKVILRLQLLKTQEANSELLLAVRDLDELLDHKNRETACHNCSKIYVKAKDDVDLQSMESGNGFLKLQQSESKEDLLEQTFYSDEEQYALGALVNEHSHMLAYSLEKKITDLNNEIDLYKKDREELEMQMEQLALDCEIWKQENHDLSTKLEQTQLREQLRMQYECSAHTEIISDLETHVESLEKELQTQAESFESDIDGTMKAKIEQEKKALLADEALRKTKWNYVNIAEQLQEELTRLSSQASSLFHDNEKIVKQALREASELRLQRTHLEKMLEETKENLTSLQNQYKKNLQQLIRLLDFKSKEKDKLKLELKNKNGKFDDYKKFQEAKLKDSLEKIQVLETEIEKLIMDKCLISRQKEKLAVEIETLETANQGNKMMLQERNLENEFLRKKIALLKQEVEKSLDEIKDLKCTGNEKENMIIQLNIEIETLGQQFNSSKQSLTKGEQEKEKLRRLVSNLTGGLLKEEHMIIRPEAEHGNNYSNEEKHYNKRSGRAGTNESETHVSFLLRRGDEEKINDITGKALELASRFPETHSEEQGIVTCTCDQSKIAEIYSNMAVLKEQNEQMETDLKEMQERYSEISLKFAEVEGERQQLVMTIRTLKSALKN